MKLYTYDKTKAEKMDFNPRWTMDDIVTEDYKDNATIHASLPASDMPLQVTPLAFFWWLNPWKHMELLFDAYKHHAEVANEWRDRYHQDAKLWKADAAERDDATERLRDELDAMRGERDAANDAVRTLRNRMKKGRRK